MNGWIYTVLLASRLGLEPGPNDFGTDRHAHEDGKVWVDVTLMGLKRTHLRGMSPAVACSVLAEAGRGLSATSFELVEVQAML